MADEETEEFLLVRVQHPRTHIGKHRWPLYTDYEINISTNSMTFTLPTSRVRRRYSEFQWLWRKLLAHNAMLIKPPPLPPKKLVGKFKKDFIESRCIALQDFLVNATSVAAYLSSAALHMFLQTSLSVNDMGQVLEGSDERDVVDIILKAGRGTEPLEGAGSRCDLVASGSSVHESSAGKRGSVAESGYITNSRSSSQLSAFVTGDKPSTCGVSSVDQGNGNGWSSGFTCLSSRSKQHPCQGTVGPSHQEPRCMSRRMTLPSVAASVLPSGQILVPEFRKQERGEVSEEFSDLPYDPSADSEFHVQGVECRNYDADDEVELEISDYDMVKTHKLLRVRRWLNSFSNDDYCMCDSSSSEEEYGSVSARQLREYAVLSTGSQMFKDSRPPPQMSERHDFNVSDDASNKADDSGFSIVHSSIDSLDLRRKNSIPGSCSISSGRSLDSVEVYRTYDVVEMIELK